jgi:dCTP diphosphatase
MNNHDIKKERNGQSEETTDAKTTLQGIKDIVHEFIKERDWEKHHDAKNLSMNLAIEAAELMEHFTWCTSQETNEVVAKNRQEIEHELSDVLLSIAAFADHYNIDLTQAFIKKMEINRKKYPKDQVKGKSDKYTAYTVNQENE